MEDRFGIPRYLFEDYCLFKRKGSWWLLRRSEHLREASRFKVTETGLRAFEKVGAFIKPTTRLIQIFGRFAGRAVIGVTRDELRGLVNGQIMDTNTAIPNGYVILTMGGRPLGLALLVNGRLRLEIRRSELSFVSRGS
jgi:NOL1/NOP2/fmu family ribosome biogenesis protein